MMICGEPNACAKDSSSYVNRDATKKSIQFDAINAHKSVHTHAQAIALKPTEMALKAHRVA